MIPTAILTISDKASQGAREDESGKLIEELLKRIDGVVCVREVMPDEQELISAALKRVADEGKANLIITTGGTGLSPRDVTPEATREILDREVPGLPEMMRHQTAAKTPRAYLSRALAGIRKRTLIINLPGSPKAVQECLEVVLPLLPHAIGILSGRDSECGLPAAK